MSEELLPVYATQAVEPAARVPVPLPPEILEHVVTTGDDEPQPSAHVNVVTGVPKRTVEAALALYLRAHGHLAEVAS